MKRSFAVLGLVWGMGLVACGPIEDFPIDPGSGGPGDGRVCYSDLDCVPNACCGEGTFAVHIADAPDCRGVTCSGSCPPDRINCGCEIPVCRNSRCQTAVSESCL